MTQTQFNKQYIEPTLYHRLKQTLLNLFEHSLHLQQCGRYSIRPENKNLVDDVGSRTGLANLHAVLSVQDVLSGLIHLQLCDNAVRSINSNVNGLTIGLVSGATLDVDHVLLTVALNNLALLTLEGTAKDLNLILDSDGDRSHLITKKGWW